MFAGEEIKLTTASEYLKKWITDFLSEPQELLNGFPSCPYAKKSLIENKIKFYDTVDYVSDIGKVCDDWDENIEAVIFIVPDNVDPLIFVNDVKKINENYMSKGFICLEDHKDIPEPFFHLRFNNGKYNIIICQKSEKINQASEILLKKGYYKNWSKELYDQVVSWRHTSLSNNS
jgi:hypothetical protein